MPSSLITLTISRPCFWPKSKSIGECAGVTLTAGMLLATGLSPTTRNYIRDSIAQHRDTKKLAELVMDEIEKRATNSALDEIGGK